MRCKIICEIIYILTTVKVEVRTRDQVPMVLFSSKVASQLKSSTILRSRFHLLQLFEWIARQKRTSGFSCLTKRNSNVHQSLPGVLRVFVLLWHFSISADALNTFNLRVDVAHVHEGSTVVVNEHVADVSVSVRLKNRWTSSPFHLAAYKPSTSTRVEVSAKMIWYIKWSCVHQSLISLAPSFDTTSFVSNLSNFTTRAGN